MNYDFSQISLGPLSTLSSGSYFTRLLIENKSIFVQTPKCLTKQAFIKSGKKNYTDIMLNNNDTIFINWIEQLESRCQELMFDKSNIWFETKLEKDDIESAFTSPFKLYKSGKFYLLRVNVNPNIKIFNESNSILGITDVAVDNMLISILEIEGIRFTSRNFQIDFALKQSLIVSPDPFLEQCFIQRPSTMVSNTLTNGAKESSEHEMSSVQHEMSSVQHDMNENIDTFIDEVLQEIQPEQVLIDPTINSTNEDISEQEQLTKESLIEANVNDDELSDTEVCIDDTIIKGESIPDTDNSNHLTEFDSDTLEINNEPLHLKNHSQVYYELYTKAREKAKELKKNAIKAFLEAKNIKQTYMLDDLDESEDENENDTDGYEDNTL